MPKPYKVSDAFLFAVEELLVEDKEGDGDAKKEEVAFVPAGDSFFFCPNMLLNNDGFVFLPVEPSRTLRVD